MRSRFPGLLSAVVAGMGLASPPARAAPDERRVAVLPVLVAGEESGAHVQERFDSSLHQALSGGSFGIVPAQAQGECKSPQCYVQVADQTDSALVVRGTATIEGRDYTVRVELIDAESGTVVRQGVTTCEICTFGEAAEKLGFEAAAMRDTIGELLGPAPATNAGAQEDAELARVGIASTPSGALVVIDGSEVGTTPFDGELGPGTHLVQLSKQGFESATKKVVVEAGRAQDLELELMRRDREGLSRPVKIGLGGAALGVGVVSLATGVALIVLHDRPYEANCSGDHVDVNGTCEFRYDTLTGGIVATVVGAIAAAGGATLLGLTLRKTNVRAGLGPGSASLTWRFR